MTNVSTRGASITGRMTDPAQFLAELKSSHAQHYLPAARPDLEMLKRLADALDQRASATTLERLILGRVEREFETSFTTNEERAGGLRLAIKFTEGESVLSSRARQITPIATELTLNAIFSANTSHKEMTGRPYEYSKQNPCSLRIAIGATHMTIICTDPVGSLKRDKLLDRLLETYKAGSEMRLADHAAGQAGLGCKIIVDNSTDFFAYGTRFKFTTVGCILPIQTSGRLIETAPKSLHICAED